MPDRQRKPPPLFYNGLHIPYVIADCRDLSYGARMLYAALCETDQPDGSMRQPTLEEAALTLGSTRKEIVEFVLELVNKGFIEHDPENKITPLQFAFVDHDYFYETAEEAEERDATHERIQKDLDRRVNGLSWENAL